MSSEPEQLKARLTSSPAARAKFMSDFLELLGKNGVNIHDPKVLDAFKLNLDLKDSQNPISHVASSIVITVTA